MMSLLYSSCGRQKFFMCTSAKKCLLFSTVFTPRLRLGQKTQTRIKKIHFLALVQLLFILVLLLTISLFGKTPKVGLIDVKATVTAE
jgi:hypothetical protein